MILVQKTRLSWRRSVHSILTAVLAAAAILASPVAFAQQKAAPVKIAESAMVQVRALQSIKIAKTPVDAKIDSRLYLGALNLARDVRLAPLTDFRFVKAEADGRVPVDIILTAGASIKPVVEALAANGGVVRGKSRSARRVNARVTLASLTKLAALPEVLKVRQAIPRFTNALTTSQGDLTHDAQGARAYYGTSGAGVKVGVLSDGVDSLATLQASGDLPASVQVIAGQAGAGDEGSAMLEIVHDLAPGAALAFATADPDEATFAANILALAAAGCNIIVDDVIYLDESPFEDGIVAQAVNTVTAAGVLYFSSAGNEGNKAALTSGTWEGDFFASVAADPGPLAGANLHDFGDGGNSILVEVGGGNPPVLVWAEHYTDTNGYASTDFDLYDMDGGLTTIFDASTDVQDGSGGDDWPVEYIAGGTFAGERLLIDKFASGSTSSVPMMNLIVFRGELANGLSTSGALRGHSAAVNAFAVAATPAAVPFDPVTPPGPYPGLFTAANASESFTSDGPRRIILDTAGSELTPGNRTKTGGVVRQKPDITAADGVSCSAPGFNPFYGTSAAAPHAAAIAALVKAAVPSLTQAQVRTALVSTAIDIQTAGVDNVTGAGIVMAGAALAAAGAAPVATLNAGTAVRTELIGNGNAYLESNEVDSVIVPLTNNGGVGATSISAVLTSSTPGVTVNAGTSAYSNLAVGASGNNATPFVFTVGPSVQCGATIDLTLTVTYSGGTGAPQTFPITFRVGAPGTPVTFSYTGPAVPIPDAADLSGTAPGAPVVADLVVSGVTGGIYDVNLRIDGTSCSTTAGSTTVGIDHTFVSDLQLTLRAPSATAVLVVDQTDGGGNNFCQTLLDDEGGGSSIQSVASSSAPFTGTYTPNAPLAAFRGQSANGTWQLQAQDFFSGDTGNIRAYSLVITPAVCTAPALTAIVSGTMSVSGTFHVGSTVTYTVTLRNSGGLAQADNPGSEFTDVLPSGLTLVGASATSGTAVATIATNTVTWNGPIAAVNGTVTITITATVNPSSPGTSVSNQGAIGYDADGNGTNESAAVTDDPGVGGTSDPTAFAVSGALVSATKTVAGTFTVGSTVTYSILLSNTGNLATADNPGNELTDVLPSGLTLVGASATSGTAVATIATRTVTWNGGLAAGGSATVTITATIESGMEGSLISNQASVSYDSDGNGTNDATGLSDDPAVGGAANPTVFTVVGEAIHIPALSHLGLALLALSLSAIGAWRIAKQ